MTTPSKEALERCTALANELTATLRQLQTAGRGAYAISRGTYLSDLVLIAGLTGERDGELSSGLAAMELRQRLVITDVLAFLDLVRIVAEIKLEDMVPQPA